MSAQFRPALMRKICDSNFYFKRNFFLNFEYWLGLKFLLQNWHFLQPKNTIFLPKINKSFSVISVQLLQFWFNFHHFGAVFCLTNIDFIREDSKQFYYNQKFFFLMVLCFLIFFKTVLSGAKFILKYFLAIVCFIFWCSA